MSWVVHKVRKAYEIGLEDGQVLKEMTLIGKNEGVFLLQTLSQIIDTSESSDEK